MLITFKDTYEKFIKSKQFEILAFTQYPQCTINDSFSYVSHINLLKVTVFDELCETASAR